MQFDARLNQPSGNYRHPNEYASIGMPENRFPNPANYTPEPQKNTVKPSGSSSPWFVISLLSLLFGIMGAWLFNEFKSKLAHLAKSKPNASLIPESSKVPEPSFKITPISDEQLKSMLEKHEEFKEAATETITAPLGTGLPIEGDAHIPVIEDTSKLTEIENQTIQS